MHPRLASRLPGAQTLTIHKLVSPKEHLKSGSVSFVRISHVENPSFLYVQPLSTVGENKWIFKELQSELKEVLTEEMWNESKNFKSDFYKIGQLCAYRKKSDKIFRVVIERISRKCKRMQIRSVDVGWRELCDQENLLPLPFDPLINRYPLMMSLRVRLFNLEPPENHKDWPMDCTKELVRIAIRDLCLKICR